MLTVRTGALPAPNQTIAGCVSSGWALAGAEPDESLLSIVLMGAAGAEPDDIWPIIVWMGAAGAEPDDIRPINVWMDAANPAFRLGAPARGGCRTHSVAART